MTADRRLKSDRGFVSSFANTIPDPYDAPHDHQACGRGGMADATDLRKHLSARRETGDAELPRFGEPCNGNPEPSPEPRLREGVETRRAAPNPCFEGTVKG